MTSNRSHQRITVGRGRAAATLAIVVPICVSVATITVAAGGEISWVEDFADDPVLAGRFSIPPGHDPTRFSYDALGQRLTVHYDTFLPTAWYIRPLDPIGGMTFGRDDDFEFSVTFRIGSTDFFADPDHFAQIGWALINSQTTGEDRAGGSSGPFAFDLVGFDFFPNVTAFGGPNMGPAVIHSDDGTGFFSKIDFAFGAETQIDAAFGDETIALDTIYTARVTYDAGGQVATLTIHDGNQFLTINADGAGGPGGVDGDVTTIQTFLQIAGPFEADTFALAAWQDTFNPFDATVIANVDVMRIEFLAPGILLGDLNDDGLVDGQDVGALVQTMLSASPDPGAVARGDFNGDTVLDLDDVPQFIAALLLN